MLRVIFVGDDSLLIHCAETLRAAGDLVVAVVTENPAVQSWATDTDLPLIDPNPDLANALGTLDYDWLLSVTNLRRLPPEVLRTARRGAVNFHDGPLPRYGGLNAPVWALLAGEAAHGISWHLMTEHCDRGDLLLQRQFSIEPGATAMSLNVACFEAAIASFPQLLDQLRQPVVTGTSHILDRSTWHRRADRPPALATLDPAQPAHELARIVRALDFGGYPNPLALPKLAGHHEVVLVGEAVPSEAHGTLPAGSLAPAAENRLALTTGEGVLELGHLRTPEGAALTAPEALERLGIGAGQPLPVLGAGLLRQVDAEASATARHEEFWARRLATLQGPELPGGTRTSGNQTFRLDIPARAGIATDTLVARFALLVARLAGTTGFDVRFAEAGAVGAPQGLERWFNPWVPLRVEFDESATLTEGLEALQAEQARIREHRGFARDLWSRRPGLTDRAQTRLAAGVWLTSDLVEPPPFRAAIQLTIGPDAMGMLEVDPGVIGPDLARTLAALLTAPFPWSAGDTRWSDLLLFDAEDLHRVLEEWNATARPLTEPAVVHRCIEAQVERSPDAIALASEGDTLTYRELNDRANRLARHLTTVGVAPDVLVGLCCERSLHMVVAMLAIHKAGGAYVPIDPAYPASRIALMLEDSQAPVLVTQEAVLGELPPHRALTFCMDRDWATLDAATDGNLQDTATAHSLAYCIYTSGSTGRPKAVMVEHRNVQNFFAAMDDRLGTDPGVWLAVTSLSFDISVLELLWTLGRGYTVVIQGDERRSAAAGPPPANADRGIDFSLFYFSADQGADPSERYRLLLEGARYADTNGFTAVWTPERHFHAFGGLYPNPAVTGAAVAAITSRVGIRAGSCVLPLHHPARVAEEWAVVDNLSNGRVGLSFATGWQPDDFIFRPENYTDTKARMLAAMDQVRSLWRGESLTFDGPRGPVTVRTMPRPIQPELPIWFTTAGNPESYELAGRQGVHVLTHLLGQSVEELADKITLYRRAWRAAGHPGEGSVALMLHTFIGEDDASVKELVREPMKAYLGTSVSLIKGYAAAFPIFRKAPDGSEAALDFNALSPEEMDALLEFSFERYYETSGLFGTVETCAALVDRLKGIGVSEVACLIDFGVAPDLVLAHLRYLNRLRLQTSRTRPESADYSLPAQIVRHRVTHLQCTPSLAGMLVADDRSREALRRLRVMCVGGEALPNELAATLRRLVPGDVWNMYGPTETTVWSTMHLVGEEAGAIPLGRPLANTTLRVLDRFDKPVPVGVPGELYIGGLGVTRGYLRRPELTGERFPTDPFERGSGSRMYRTGDLVRWREDGVLEFLGRTDFQVKVRGHRIEIGEIESCLRSHPLVREAVVVSREAGPGDQRLGAFVVASGHGLEVTALRRFIGERLPQFMWPSTIVLLPELPLTPNRKVDRNALPMPGSADASPRPETADRVATPPASALEQTIAAAWREVLQTGDVGVDDNFFDLGGHSLLAVQVHGRLKKAVTTSIAIVDLFRFPTIRTLAAHLAGDRPDRDVGAAQDRAQSRRAALQRRLARRGSE